MGFFSLGRFVVAAYEFARLDPAVRRMRGAEAKRHRADHGKIVMWGTLGGFAGVFSGIAVVIIASQKGSFHSAQDALGLAIAAPLINIPVGILAGIGWRCGFASNDFLQGPVGAKWARLVGTSSPELARAIALTVGLLATGFSVCLLVLAALGKV